MILKHRDKEVLRFDWVAPFGAKNVEVNSAAERFLPLSFRERVRRDPTALRYELETWLLGRTPPLRRAGIRDMLRHLGFNTEDADWARNLITFSRGLSLNDVHWVVRDDSTETWAGVNLYENAFSTSVASMAFTGDRHDDVRGASTSPEYSTNGNLRKCWRRLGGEVLLFKGGGHDGGGFFEHPNAVGLEPFSEYYAAQVAEAMKLPHVPYDLARFKYRLCSTCPLFTSDKTGYLPARGLLSADEARRDVRFADIFFFDAVIFNTDRHLGNFGFLVDNDANEISGIAPIFDNGYGLFAQAYSNPGKRDDELCDLRRFLSRQEPKLFRNWLDIPGGVTDAQIERLRGLEDFTFKPHSEFTWPDNRLEVIQYFLRNRIRDIVKHREKADGYLKISDPGDTIKPTEETDAKKGEKQDSSSSLTLPDQIKAAVKLFPTISRKRLAEMYNVGPATIGRHLKALQDAGQLKRVGSRKTGHWRVVDDAVFRFTVRSVKKR